MSFSATCPTCKKKLRAKEQLIGKRVKCPACGNALLVQRPATVATSRRPAGDQQEPHTPIAAESSPITDFSLDTGDSEASQTAASPRMCSQCGSMGAVASLATQKAMRSIVFFCLVAPVIVVATGGIGLLFMILIHSIYEGIWTINAQVTCSHCGHGWVISEGDATT